MKATSKNKGSIIAYQLRPHKAIERNLFINLLRNLDKFRKINLEDYRYVGLGGAFLEDFKILHSEFGIVKMDCIETNEFAFSRQNFNNPYDFIKLFPKTSTEYITEGDFKEDVNQIIWWDYTEPKALRQQLKDIEWTCEKISDLDILKFTFNAEITSFANTHKWDSKKYKLINSYKVVNYKDILKFLAEDPTFKNYFPETITSKNIEQDFSTLIRAMAIRAVKRGLVKSNPTLDFHHLAAFTYADGQKMTTLTGIICSKEDFKDILHDTSLSKWKFYRPNMVNEIILPAHIEVPVMTIPERVEIDKRIHLQDVETLAKQLDFFYGANMDEHMELIAGYCKFYKYLPYYSKVIY